MNYIGCHVHDQTKIDPNKIAIATTTTQLTYGELSLNIRKIQQILLQQSTKKQEKIALYMDEPIAFFQTYFAAITIGWMVLPIHQQQTNISIQKAIHTIQPRFIVTNRPNKFLFCKENILSLEDIHDVSLSHPYPTQYEPKEDDLFYIGQTSGTSGNPKFFVRTHRSWLLSFEEMEEVFPIDSTKSISAPGPLTHSLSLCMATYALHRGATFYAMEQFDATVLYEKITTETVDVIFVVPSMLYDLVKMPPTMSTITYISAGDMLQAKMYEQTKIVYPNRLLFEYYGASELSYITYKNEGMHQEKQTVTGTPFPSVTVTICNDDGKPVQFGEIGKVFVKSPFACTQYISDHQLEENEYGICVGDLGYIDNDGYVSLIGRENNMIISGGHNIYPEEVERVIHSNDQVEQAVVVGVPHEKFGQIVVAYIQLRSDDSTIVSTVKKLCRQTLPRYKRPKKYVIVEAFPRTNTGKIIRSELGNNKTKEVQ
ncbi:AMP-binding protein [Pseudogracilibacillus sp. ICA-222130]|uniref:AMP-binding protein n=1 Tax=Pseudogracilibacillus sp. ICA-222130 TaxID=3134655 RepID=UPI0030C01684